MRSDEYSSFVRVLFGLESPTPVSEETGEMEWIDPSLNDSQKDAIKFALGSREMALIHGPPGVSTNINSRLNHITKTKTDWQNPYIDRTYSPNAKA